MIPLFFVNFLFYSLSTCLLVHFELPLPYLSVLVISKLFLHLSNSSSKVASKVCANITIEISKGCKSQDLASEIIGEPRLFRMTETKVFQEMNMSFTSKGELPAL